MDTAQPLGGDLAVIKQGVMYIHLGPHARFVTDRIDAQIAAIDDGTWAPELLVDLDDASAPLGGARKAKAAVAA